MPLGSDFFLHIDAKELVSAILLHDFMGPAKPDDPRTRIAYPTCILPRLDRESG